MKYMQIIFKNLTVQEGAYDFSDNIRFKINSDTQNTSNQNRETNPKITLISKILFITRLVSALNYCLRYFNKKYA